VRATAAVTATSSAARAGSSRRTQNPRRPSRPHRACQAISRSVLGSRSARKDVNVEETTRCHAHSDVESDNGEYRKRPDAVKTGNPAHMPANGTAVIAGTSAASKAADNATAASDHGTVTGSMTTGPAVGSSSVAWETVGGVMTSTAFGTVDGLTEQMGEDTPGAQTPKVN
jgi:hypothetical protein